MLYREQWQLIASRIRGLVEAGELHSRFLTINSADTYNRARHLSNQARGIFAAVQEFREAFQHAISCSALKAIDRFLQDIAPFLADSSSPQYRQEQVWAILVILPAFEGEISHLLADAQQSVRFLCERAFAHLQRTIVVEPEFRAKWQNAYRTNEVTCEGLGSIHLLLHGIWAFKVDAKGQRTDLVFQEPAQSLVAEAEYVAGFVLTEWKLYKGTADAARLCADAREQTRLYASGSLAGTELRETRYIIVVSEHAVLLPADVGEEGVTYRHLNIAVDPRPPSREAKSR